MAEHTIETRILLRYDTFSRWMNSNVILKIGEAAIASFPNNRVIDSLSNTTPENTPPAIGIKIGDGEHYFRELPWVQAIAADVYNWAKQSSKPIYTANEIQGLRDFIEENMSGGGEVSIAPRIYSITSQDDKYYLQYKENTEDDWTIDVNHYIDLGDLTRLLNWVKEQNLEDYADLTSLTGLQTISLFNSRLNYTDTPVNNYFVTAVDESGGKISVTRARPTFANISGTLSVEAGGTGRTSLSEDNVLVGNGTGPVKLVPIAESIASNTQLVPNYLVKAYVDNAVAGLSGAMHFIGDATVVINNGSNVDPRIQDYNFSKAQPGDVILYDAKEFVWTGSFWRLLGDEGSYAVKGSIVDTDISPDAAIQQSKIANLEETFASKVDKVEGKTLTSNDFTDELKEKLDNIDEGAQRNVIEHIFLNSEEIPPTTVGHIQNSIDLQVKEFDDQSAQKLAGIQAEAQVNKIEKIIYDGEEVVPDENKTVSITSDPHTEHENKIEAIFINGTEQLPNQQKQVKITIDEAALNLQVIKGARVPKSGLYEDIEITQDKKLELARIAKTGNIEDIVQTYQTYVILDCGSSTDVL